MNASGYKWKKTDSIFLSLQRQLSFVWIFLLQLNTLWRMRETRISYFAFYVS